MEEEKRTGVISALGKNKGTFEAGCLSSGDGGLSGGKNSENPSKKGGNFFLSPKGRQDLS